MTAALVVAAIIAFVLVSSSSPPPTLTYSQFLAYVSHHVVKTVDLAQSVGGMSSGTLVNGVGFRVVIPEQASRSSLTGRS